MGLPVEDRPKLRCKAEPIFTWLGEKKEKDVNKSRKDVIKKQYYSGFKINSLTALEGSCVLVQVDVIDDTYDVARILEVYQNDADANPRRAKVQWYTHIDQLKKTHLKGIPKGLPALDGDCEVVKDMRSYVNDIDIESISCLCHVEEVTGGTQPDTVKRPLVAVGQMFVCRFSYNKKVPYLTPITKKEMYNFLGSPQSKENENNTNSNLKQLMSPTHVRCNNSENILRSSQKNGLILSPVVSLKKLTSVENICSTIKQTVKRKILVFDDKVEKKKCRSDSDKENESPSNSYSRPVAQSRVLKSNEISNLLSDDDPPITHNALTPKQKRKATSETKSRRKSSTTKFHAFFLSDSDDENESLKDRPTLSTGKRVRKRTEKLKSFSGNKTKEKVLTSRNLRTPSKIIHEEPTSKSTSKKEDKCSKLEIENNLNGTTKASKSTPLKKSPKSVQVKKSSQKVNKSSKLVTPNSKPAIRAALIGSNKSQFEHAKQQLHVSAIPETLPCREDEFQQIFSFVEGKLLDSAGGCMYVSGVPGTGKTATIREVVRVLRQCVNDGSIDDFSFIDINAMKLTKPHQLWVQIWEQLTGQRVTADHACSLLEKTFSAKGPKQKNVFLLLDELDLLWTKKQDVMYNLFEWSGRVGSRLTVVTIANTMDLPERMMINRVSSRLGLTRMTFQPYTFQQLQEIISSRLKGIKAFDSDAIQLVARKVAAVSGDARRALDVCRRATELAELNPNCIGMMSPKKSPRKRAQDLVGMGHVSQAITEMFSSPKILAIKRCSQMEKYILQAVLTEFNRIGIEEAIMTRVLEHLETVCRIEGMNPPSSSDTMHLINGLSSQRILFTEHSRLDLALRLRLNISVEDVSYALSV